MYVSLLSPLRVTRGVDARIQTLEAFRLATAFTLRGTQNLVLGVYTCRQLEIIKNVRCKLLQAYS